MSEPFLGEIKMTSFAFAPRGWALCNGQLLPINQNQALFSLLGSTYGGDGRVNFALPNLQGRVPIHVGSGHTLGERAGEQAHTLSTSELPAHTHTAQASGTAGTQNVPANNLMLSQRAAEMSIPVKPDLILMDGRISFVSGGPAVGLAVHPGVILASGDPVALDVQGVRLLQNYAAVNHLGMDAWFLPQIKTAVKHGLGVRSDDQVILVR